MKNKQKYVVIECYNESGIYIDKIGIYDTKNKAIIVRNRLNKNLNEYSCNLFYIEKLTAYKTKAEFVMYLVSLCDEDCEPVSLSDAHRIAISLENEHKVMFFKKGKYIYALEN